MRTPLALALLILAAPAAAQDLSPETAPRPEARPERAIPDGAPVDEGAGEGAAEVPVSDPRGGPETDDAQTPPDAGPDGPAREGERDRLALDASDRAACLADLSALGMEFEEADPVIDAGDADCGVLHPVTVSQVAPGVTVAPGLTLRCPAARAMGMWVRDFVLPAAGRLDRGALTGIATGPGYVCRDRVGSSGLSEHAVGNAVDILGFSFADGGTIPVQPREAEGSHEEAFQDAVRASACLDFTTVLGPGSNASHDDHLHLDVKERNGGWRLCEQGGARPE